MDNIKVTIRDRKYRNNFIEMSIDEYVKFIKEQSDLLNIKQEEKPLYNNLKRSHPGLRDSGPHTTYEAEKGKLEINSGITVNIPDRGKVTTEEVAKGISKKLNQASIKI